MNVNDLSRDISVTRESFSSWTIAVESIVFLFVTLYLLDSELLACSFI